VTSTITSRTHAPCRTCRRLRSALTKRTSSCFASSSRIRPTTEASSAGVPSAGPSPRSSPSSTGPRTPSRTNSNRRSGRFPAGASTSHQFTVYLEAAHTACELGLHGQPVERPPRRPVRRCSPPGDRGSEATLEAVFGHEPSRSCHPVVVIGVWRVAHGCQARGPGPRAVAGRRISWPGAVPCWP
jgi:hypothetical protein